MTKHFNEEWTIEKFLLFFWGCSQSHNELRQPSINRELSFSHAKKTAHQSQSVNEIIKSQIDLIFTKARKIFNIIHIFTAATRSEKFTSHEVPLGSCRCVLLTMPYNFFRKHINPISINIIPCARRHMRSWKGFYSDDVYLYRSRILPHSCFGEEKLVFLCTWKMKHSPKRTHSTACACLACWKLINPLFQYPFSLLLHVLARIDLIARSVCDSPNLRVYRISPCVRFCIYNFMSHDSYCSCLPLLTQQCLPCLPLKCHK